MRYLTPVLCAAVASVLSTAPAYADLGDQLFKLVAIDGAAGDRFGGSVAISGEIAIVGARGNDDNGDFTGSAYLFDTTTGQQLFKLMPIDRAAGDEFGFSVSISGTTAIVGAPFNDDNGSNSGSAYLFDISDPENPLQIAKLLPNDGAADDLFGLSLAISGDTAIVAAPGDDDNGTDSGSAYLFDTTTGKQIAKLLPKDGAADDGFGRSVAISGATAIVGVNDDDDNGEDSGSAYFFDTTTGQQLFKLLSDDGAVDDNFGWSVAISGETAIVGANHDGARGSAYLFDTITGRQIIKLRANDGADSDDFGESVAISGDTTIVGAERDDDSGADSGSAYLFDSTTCFQIAKLLPEDGAAGDRFGKSIAISGATGKEVAVVGAPCDGDNGTDSGSVYLFDAAAAPACPSDLDGSGAVDIGDLLRILTDWGPCE